MTVELEPAFVSIDQAATFLGISRSTAYRLAKAGTFPVPVVAVGGRRIVHLAALRAFADDAAASSTPRRLRFVRGAG